MKLSSFLVMISMASVLASESYSQTITLNLDKGGATIREVLSKIEDQSEYYFMYSGKVIDVNREVSVHVKNKKIEDVLNSLFAGTNVEYTIKDRIIVLTTPEIFNTFSQVTLQQKMVSGGVHDENGDSLPGVTVLEKGTGNGTITDAEGKYSLTVSGTDAVLVFSFVGMKTQEIIIGNRTIIDVSLFFRSDWTE